MSLCFLAFDILKHLKGIASLLVGSGVVAGQQKALSQVQPLGLEARNVGLLCGNILRVRRYGTNIWAANTVTAAIVSRSDRPT